MDSDLRKRGQVLGVPVDAVDYESAFSKCLELVSLDRPAAVTAANTHLVSLGRHDPEFGSVMRAFDLVLPDGMPLVWALRRAGWKLEDRCYGPYFMEYALRQSPPDLRHFFFGGSEQTLGKLRENALRLNPELNIAGAFSPPFRMWTEADEQDFADRIRSTEPDFIWVCLGGEKQERWIVRNRHRYDRGVFLGVGDAFALLAGERPFAPTWMQRNGLTWLYRLGQDPARLWSRYVKFNSLFLLYWSLGYGTCSKLGKRPKTGSTSHLHD